jgi:penicillin-binding protein 1A
MAFSDAGRPAWWGSKRFRRIARISVGVAALFCGLLGGLVAYAGLTLPPLDNIGQATTTITVLDRNGKVIGEFGHDARTRVSVKLDQISPVLVAATVAVEDRDFYSEGAFNVRRVARALFVDVLARQASQGASTITQQLARLAFLSPDKSAMRKLREALLANSIDARYSKDEILEKYLNLVYYGAGATGIETAAQRYFGKHAAQLDLREASLLAGLPQAPSYLDPTQHPEAAMTRQHVVLNAMVEARMISAAEAREVDPLVPDGALGARNQKAVLDDLRHGHAISSGPAPHFVGYVREELERTLGTDVGLGRRNLTVTTTLDMGVQQHAQQAVVDGVAGIAHGANNGALLMLDAHSGDIVAMVGSAQFDNASIDGQFNATTGRRRPGSTFKPLVYATAFREQRLTPLSMLDDTAAQSRKLGGVQNFERTFMGPMTAAQALLLSRNVAAEQAMSIAGVDAVIAFAHTLGISDDLARNLTTAIGSSAVRMDDLTSAYAALANGGTRVTPRAIRRVVDGDDGTVLLDAGAPQGRPRVMSPEEAYRITHILRGQPHQFSLPFTHDVAGKSGTTDDFVDAWYVTYSPDWVVTAWVAHTGGATEVGMDNVDGLEVGRRISAPFVNTLAPPGAFRPVGLAACPGGGEPQVGTYACARLHGGGDGD